MHGPIKVKSPNNTSKWQMGFNSAFKGLMLMEERIVLNVTKDETQFSSVVLQYKEGLMHCC
jgi:conjugal transfer/entry exclusion protein